MALNLLQLRSRFFFHHALPEGIREATRCSAERSKKGMCGRPGTIPSVAMMPAVVSNTFGLTKSCFEMSLPMSVSEPARLTTMPAAVEMRSAGI